MSKHFTYKTAEHDWEFDLIFQLNYKTFVEEIPQHSQNITKTLIDKFHSENCYFICLNGRELVGMLSVRHTRPFSLEHKVPQFDSHFPGVSKLGEIRLLSVKETRRSGVVIANLFKMAGDWGFKNNLEAVIISGIGKQVPLYKKLGFIPFGDWVGKDGALFQPMYLTRNSFMASAPKSVLGLHEVKDDTRNKNFLPGPIAQSSAVKNVFANTTISHRGVDYRLCLNQVHWHLKKIMNINNCALFLGSGTLVNDVVAGQLNQLNENGLILSNGEFGARLKKNADGFALNYRVIESSFGTHFNLAEIESVLKKTNIGWLWCVHLETSNGCINDIDALCVLGEKYNTKICVDGISAVGNVEVDYSRVYLSTTVSGKGLAAFSGLGIVGFNHTITQPETAIPSYLNLYTYVEKSAIPFSGSSNLIHALYCSLDSLDWKARMENIKGSYVYLKEKFKGTSISLKENSEPSGVILNLYLPETISSIIVGDKMEQHGYQLHYRSNYLHEHNTIQVSLMSEGCLNSIDDMVQDLLEVIKNSN